MGYLIMKGFGLITHDQVLANVSPNVQSKNVLTRDRQGESVPQLPTADLMAHYQLNTGITITGSGVSNWADQSGNGRDLVQGSDTLRPTVDVDGSIIFNGIDNVLITVPFTYNQPATFYLLFRLITWNSGNRVLDGIAGNSSGYWMTGTANNIRGYAGAGTLDSNPDTPPGTYYTLSVAWNGGSSSIQVNSDAKVSGDAGTGNPGGLTLGSVGGGGSNSNIQVKEIALYDVAHDDAERAEVLAYFDLIP